MKNWIPKEMRTSTSQPSAPNEDVETDGARNDGSEDAQISVIDNDDNEDITIGAALVRVETPSSPPRSVRRLVKKITPRKN
jgi:hypothetical protein